jgi:hypothetical protein
MADGDFNNTRKGDISFGSAGGGDELLEKGDSLEESFSASADDNNSTRDSSSFDLEEAKAVGERTVDEVIRLAEKADQVKEHDVQEEEVAEAERLRKELEKELEENDGWVKILGNEELMKKVRGHLLYERIQ